ISLAILFLDKLGDPEDRPLIQHLALRLVAGQSAAGGWTYLCPDLTPKEQVQLLTFLQENRLTPLLAPARPGDPGLVPPQPGAPPPGEPLSGTKPGSLTPVPKTGETGPAVKHPGPNQDPQPLPPLPDMPPKKDAAPPKK